MKSDEKKRQRERFLLDRFLEKQGITPKNIHQPCPPDPDFVVDLDGHTVGIELTEVFIQHEESKKQRQGSARPLLQQIESITDRIVAQSKEIYFKANDTLVSATILFSQIKLDKQEGKQIADLVANKVQEMVSEKVNRWSAATDDGSALLLESISRIFIHEVPEERFAHWVVMRSGIVANLNPTHLQERIDNKAAKLNAYHERKKIEEIWLVMIADRTRASQMLHHGSDFPSESLSSPFDKTFYFCYPVDEPVIEL